MPQRLKTEVRDRILSAAAGVFAEKGFKDAKLAEVADRSGTATSNIYKYFDNKEVLFEAVVSPHLAATFLKRLRARIRELGRIDHWPTADAKGSENAYAFLTFCVDNREAVLILLRGSNGTRFAHVRGLVINEMERLTADYLRQNAGAAQPDPQLQFLIRKLFTRTVETIADILAEYEDAAEIRNAFALFWRYQLSGLEALLKP